MASRRLLVVGGTGFIGRHLCRAAQAAGYAVTSLSLRASGTDAGVRHIRADIANREGLRAALQGERFEYVVNCSAYIDHRSYAGGGRALVEDHFDGLQNLVGLLDRDCLARLVQLGSSDEYGAAPAPQREDAHEAPFTPYSFAKLCATHLTSMLWRSEGFPAATVRLFLTYGPGQAANRLLPHVIAGCLADRAFAVSAGLQQRDFCHVADVVRGILRVLEVDAACGEVVNLGSGVPLTIRSAVEQVRDEIGRGRPGFGEIAPRPNENPSLYADISKARALLGWEPQVAFADGLRETIAFYRDSGKAPA